MSTDIEVKMFCNATSSLKALVLPVNVKDLGNPKKIVFLSHSRRSVDSRKILVANIPPGLDSLD